MYFLKDDIFMLSVPTNNDFNFFWFCTASEECTQQAEKDDQLPTDLNCVRMPPTMRKRGRPKGLEKTVIGLARKRQRFSKLPYVRRPAEEKKDGISIIIVGLLHYYVIILLL